MSDAEVALELTKLVISDGDGPSELTSAGSRKDGILSVFRDCYAAVRDGGSRKE